MVQLFWAAVWFQLLQLRQLADLSALVSTPFITLALVAIMEQAGRPDLAPHAIVGATVIAVWQMAVMVSGDMIDVERLAGRLEGLICAPVPFAVVVLGRAATVTAVSFLALVESVLVARLAFRVVVEVHHVGLAVATLVVTAMAMVGTSIAMAGTFVLARSARTFQNALTYPFYLLSGAVVPVGLLPEWLRPISRLIFLSWSTDLVRDCLRAGEVAGAWFRIAVVLGLGLAYFAGGLWMLSHVLRRVRTTGTVSYA